MDDKKIAIIVHVTNEKFFQETAESLQTLEVPENFSVDILPVQGEEKFRTYNFAMKDSDAKYKIYLDEKVSVLQKNILSEIVKIFQSDDKIGIIGTSGAIKLATDGICLGSPKHTGKLLYDAEKKLQNFGDSEEEFVEVEAVDEYFVATQYDFSWREDLKIFSVAAHCLDFKREGYKSIVITQQTPCIWYRSIDFSVDKQAQKIFMEDYKNFYPLVSIIIPTFNRTKYFKIALESALNQTYRNFEIVVSDDGTNDETEKFIQPYLQKYSCIKYFRNKGFTANDNWNFLRGYNNPDAEFVNWLLDDDLFYPQKLEKMVNIMRNYSNVSLVTSVRDAIDENGKILVQAHNSHPDYFTKDMLISGETAGRLIFEWGIQNYVGEPTTSLIRKKCLRDNDMCWTEDEKGWFALIAISTWLQLFEKGDLFYFASEPMSAFRQHGEQTTNADNMKAIFATSMAQLIKTAVDKKIFITDEKLRRKVIVDWINFSNFQLLEAFEENRQHESLVTLEKTMSAVCQGLYNGYEINLPPRDYGDMSKLGKIS